MSQEERYIFLVYFGKYLDSAHATEQSAKNTIRFLDDRNNVMGINGLAGTIVKMKLYQYE